MNIQQGLIFVKTPKGEEEVRSRGLQLDRNARLVLILIDGQISAAELIEKLPGTENVSAYIASLWREGLIAPAGSFGPLDDRPVMAPGREFEASAVDDSFSPDHLLDNRVEPGISLARTSTSPDSRPGIAISDTRPRQPAAASSAAVATPFSTAGIPARPARPKLPAFSLPRGGLVKPLLWIGGGITVCVLASAAAMQFVTVPVHPKGVTAKLSAICGAGVQYDGIRLQWLPSIAMKVVGLGGTGQCPQMSELGLGTSFAGLWSADLPVTSLSIRGVTVAASQADDMLSQLQLPVSEGSSPVPVLLSDIAVTSEAMNAEGLRGEGVFEAGKLSLVQLTDENGGIDLSLKRLPVGFDLEWRSPALTIAGLNLDNVEASGVWAGNQLLARQIKAGMNGGKIKGSASFNEAGASLAANLDLAAVPSTSPLFQSLKVISEGDVSGQVRLNLGLAAGVPVRQRLALTGNLVIRNGSLSGADLLDVVQTDQPRFQASGRTLFLEMTTKADYAAGKWHLNQLVVTGAAVEARGNLMTDDERILGALSIASPKLNLAASQWQIDGIPGTWKFNRRGGGASVPKVATGGAADVAASESEVTAGTASQ